MTTAPHPRDQMAASVLAVDVDDLTLGRIKGAVRGTEFTVGSVSHEEAIARVQTDPGRVILLVEWSAIGVEEQARFCNALWGVARPDRFFILALGGPGDHGALLRAIDGPANDALCRPFHNDLLFVRLRQAVRAMESVTVDLSPRHALTEALEHGSGEVCVRSGDTVARIHVQGGHIAWAHLSSLPATVADVAAVAGVAVDAELVGAVKKECRDTGAHFMDVLVSWGLIERDRAREALRVFVTDRVKLILDLPHAAALFLPKASPLRQGEPDGARAEASPEPGPVSARSPEPFLIEPPSPESRRAVRASRAWLAGVVEEAMRLDGAVGAAVLERGTGACAAQAGESFDTEVAWSQVCAFAALGPSAEEMLALAGARCFVTRTLRGDPSLMLLVALASEDVSLGMARAAVAAVAAKARPSIPPPRPPG